MSKAGINCRSISFSYGSHRALDSLSLDIPSGEIYGLLGPNGAGKTTTIKILVGLLRAGSGSASLCGFDLASDSREAKGLCAYIPDKPHLYERLTAWEYLDFVAGLWGLPDSGGWRETAHRELANWGLAEVGDHLVESYSQGMRQKLLLIAGMIHDPRVWILDEPMSGLDPKSCRMLRDLLIGMASRGAAILLSTHTLDLAERLCHRVGILDGGRLVSEGTLDELRARASSTDARLEEIFLMTTEEGESVCR